jgi:hypothetical protein
LFEDHLRIPEKLEAPLAVDYPTDDDDDGDVKGLNMKLPDLADLIADF